MKWRECKWWQTKCSPLIRTMSQFFARTQMPPWACIDAKWACTLSMDHSIIGPTSWDSAVESVIEESPMRIHWGKLFIDMIFVIFQQINSNLIIVSLWSNQSGMLMVSDHWSVAHSNLIASHWAAACWTSSGTFHLRSLVSLCTSIHPGQRSIPAGQLRQSMERASQVRLRWLSPLWAHSQRSSWEFCQSN